MVFPQMVSYLCSIQSLKNVATPPRPRRVCVFINPFSGTKKAPEIFQNIVRPLWERAGIEITVVGIMSW